MTITRTEMSSADPRSGPRPPSGGAVPGAVFRDSPGFLIVFSYCVVTDRSLAMTWKVQAPLVPVLSWKWNLIVIVSPELPLELTSELVKSSWTFTGLVLLLNRSKKRGREKLPVVGEAATGL